MQTQDGGTIDPWEIKKYRKREQETEEVKANKEEIHFKKWYMKYLVEKIQKNSIKYTPYKCWIKRSYCDEDAMDTYSSTVAVKSMSDTSRANIAKKAKARHLLETATVSVVVVDDMILPYSTVFLRMIMISPTKGVGLISPTPDTRDTGGEE